MNGKSIPNRRQFLTAATTGTIALFAGCGSGDDGGTNNTSTGTTTPAVTTQSGPAQFARATLTGPSEITLDQSFRLALDVTNIGGQSGSLNTTVNVTEGKSNLSRPLQRDSINPGESITVRTDPIQFNAADSYTFNVGASTVSHTVTVRPKTGNLGTSFNLTETLQATVTNIAFQPAIHYSASSSEQTRLQQAPSNSLLAIIRVDVENVGSESASIAPGSFQVADGEVYRTLDGGTSLSAAHINSTPLTDLQLSPGEQRTGWVLAQVPRSTARQTVTTIYQRDATATPPDILWTAPPNRGGTRSLPQFSLANFTLPNTAMLRQDANATLAVSNDGNQTRTFRGMVEYRSDNSSDWQASHPINTTVAPGETARQNVTINSTSNGSVAYRVAPFNQTQTVEYVPPTIAFGESYTTTENVAVTVSDFQTAESVRLSGLGEPTRRTPPSGQRFVLARIQVAVVGESQRTPLSSEFRLQSGSQTFTQADEMTQPLVAPVEGTPYGGGTYGPETGETDSWYVVWTAPQQVSLTDMTVVWASQGSSTGAQGETARWTEGSQTASR